MFRRWVGMPTASDPLLQDLRAICRRYSPPRARRRSSATNRRRSGAVGAQRRYHDGRPLQVHADRLRAAAVEGTEQPPGSRTEMFAPTSDLPDASSVITSKISVVRSTDYERRPVRSRSAWSRRLRTCVQGDLSSASTRQPHPGTPQYKRCGSSSAGPMYRRTQRFPRWRASRPARRRRSRKGPTPAARAGLCPAPGALPGGTLGSNDQWPSVGDAGLSEPEV